MSMPAANPRRLSLLPESEDTLGVGRMFRSARELPDEELPTLRWRLRTSQRLRAMRPQLFLRVALVVGIVFCTGGVVGAAVWRFWARQQAPVVASPTPAVAPTARQRASRPASALPATPALSESALDPPEPTVHEPASAPDEPKPVATPARRRAPVRVALLPAPTPPPAPSEAAEVAPPPAAPSPIAVEQSLLGRAIRTLRDDRDARAALALLAQHAERFPAGALSAEATMLRIEALLDLGRRDEALSVLDRAPLASLPNRDEQLVVRGELRAAQGRWREAEQDFDGALRERHLPAARAKARSLQERALWGRAAARSRLGDREGARADIELYLRHFPGGQFAGRAASLLQVVP